VYIQQYDPLFQAEDF